jgi:hypothetical protein
MNLPIDFDVGEPIRSYKPLPISSVRFNSVYFDKPQFIHDVGERALEPPRRSTTNRFDPFGTRKDH